MTETGVLRCTCRDAASACGVCLAAGGREERVDRAECALVSSAEAYRVVEEARQMRSERDDARRWAVRLEGEHAAALAVVDLARTTAVDAIAARETALGNLATANDRAAGFRAQRDEACQVVALLNSMVLSGEEHSDQSREAVRRVLR